ncbi:MAG: hypothetical protein HYY08_00400 [Firmicutes bacterium]|nr:hypothetical protein [Bacillota bacterium]
MTGTGSESLSPVSGWRFAAVAGLLIVAALTAASPLALAAGAPGAAADLQKLRMEVEVAKAVDSLGLSVEQMRDLLPILENAVKLRDRHLEEARIALSKQKELWLKGLREEAQKLEKETRILAQEVAIDLRKSGLEVSKVLTEKQLGQLKKAGQRKLGERFGNPGGQDGNAVRERLMKNMGKKLQGLREKKALKPGGGLRTPEQGGELGFFTRPNLLPTVIKVLEEKLKLTK